MDAYRRAKLQTEGGWAKGLGEWMPTEELSFRRREAGRKALVSGCLQKS